MFIEAITTLVGYDVNKKVNIFKSLRGDTPFSATSAPDIGGEQQFYHAPKAPAD